MGQLIRPWSEIRRFYASIPSQVEMEKLVCSIESSPFVSGLFGWTSHCELQIVQTYVDAPYRGPFLRIRQLGSAKRIEFCYLDTHVESRQWRREVDSSEAFSQLVHFFEQLHWFTTYPVTSTLERRETR